MSYAGSSSSSTSNSNSLNAKLDYASLIVFILSVLIFLVVLCCCVTDYNKHDNLLKAYQSQPNGMAALAELERTKVLKEMLSDPERYDHVIDLVRNTGDEQLPSIVELQKIELVRFQMMHDRIVKQSNGMPTRNTVEEKNDQIEQLKAKITATK